LQQGGDLGAGLAFLLTGIVINTRVVGECFDLITARLDIGTQPIGCGRQVRGNFLAQQLFQRIAGEVVIEQPNRQHRQRGSDHRQNQVASNNTLFDNHGNGWMGLECMRALYPN